MSKLLVLHALHENLRQTNLDFVASYGRYWQGGQVHYLNVMGAAAAGKFDEEFDAAIITTELLGLRFAPSWPSIVERMTRILSNVKKIVICPQDDYTYSRRLDDLVESIGVTHIWTPIQNDLEILYPRSADAGVEFRVILTGYADPQQWWHFSRYSKPFSSREIDIGQRVRALPAQFGRGGQRKGELAAEFGALAKKDGFENIDISSDSGDVLLREEWYEFLGNCKFTISRKGGSSLADTNNELAWRIRWLNGIVPSMYNFVNGLLPPARGVHHGNFYAESPRLFEAAALEVCQVLEEDNYLGDAILPWVDYIPINSDYSNLDDVFSFMRNEESCLEMTKSAKRKLIDSGDYSFAKYVQDSQIILGFIEDASSFALVDHDEKFRIQLSEIHALNESIFRAPAFEFLKALSSPETKGVWEFINKFEAMPETFTHKWVSLTSTIKARG